MADKVIKLDQVANVEHGLRDGAVILKVTGRSGGKDVRVEIELDSYDTPRAVNSLRAGVKYHAERWTTVQRQIGNES